MLRNINKEAIKVLKIKIIKFKKNEGLRWAHMQQPYFSKAFDVPCGWNVLYKIVQKEGVGVHPNTLKSLLDFFGVPCVQTFNKITLTLTEKKEHEDSDNN